MLGMYKGLGGTVDQAITDLQSEQTDAPIGELENVPLDPHTRIPDYNSAIPTENTRVAYPIEFIPNAELSGRGGHPSNIFFLTCDAFGVLPPLSRLTPAQAMHHFLLGYTAKVAGTETGLTAALYPISSV